MVAIRRVGSIEFSHQFEQSQKEGNLRKEYSVSVSSLVSSFQIQNQCWDYIHTYWIRDNLLRLKLSFRSIIKFLPFISTDLNNTVAVNEENFAPFIYGQYIFYNKRHETCSSRKKRQESCCNFRLEWDLKSSILLTETFCEARELWYFRGNWNFPGEGILHSIIVITVPNHERTERVRTPLNNCKT